MDTDGLRDSLDALEAAVEQYRREKPQARKTEVSRYQIARLDLLDALSAAVLAIGDEIAGME